MSIDPANIYGAPSEALPPMSAAVTRTHAWKDGDGPGFHDILDAVNPLQHIPVVSAIYRWLTGDVPGNVAQLAGDTLYGGPIGLATGLFGIAFKEETGKDPGAMAIALLGGDTATAPAAAAPAAAAPATVAPTATAPESPVAPVLTADASTDPAAAPVAPAHPPIPLAKTPSIGAPLPLPSAVSTAESSFLAQSTARQRGLMGARTITQPIPLKLSGAAMQLAPLRMSRATVAPATPPSATTTAAEAPPAADVAQRMLDALEKYRVLQQKRGGAVDLSQ
jgi:hypothetical protein